MARCTCGRDYLTDLLPAKAHKGACASCQANAQRRTARDNRRRILRHHQISQMVQEGASTRTLADALDVSIGRARQLRETVTRS